MMVEKEYYLKAIKWIAENEDMTWLDEYIQTKKLWGEPKTVYLIMHLHSVKLKEVIRDLKHQLDW